MWFGVVCRWFGVFWGGLGCFHGPVAKLTYSFDFHHNSSSKHLNIHYFNNKS